MQAPFLEDFVLVLRPDGRTQREISLTQAIAGSPFKGILNLVTEHANHDYFHANNLDYVTPALAAAHPYAKAGDLLLSFRELNLIALLDPETGLLTWAMPGPWRGQHDPDMLPNGNIIIFDNNGHVGPGGRSRVVEFSPVTQQIVWRYTGSEDDPFDVRSRGSQQRLANGDTLVTDSHGARIIEVAQDGRIVWEFHNPNREGADGATGSIRSGERIPAEAIAFPFNYGRIGAAVVSARPGS